MSSYICTCKNPDSFLFSFSIIIWVSRSPKRVNLQLKTIRGKIFPYAERNPRASVHPVACLGKPNAETPGPFTPVWLLEIFALCSYPGRRHVPRGWRQEEGCTQRAPKGRPPPPRLPREGMVTTARMGGSGPPRTAWPEVGTMQRNSSRTPQQSSSSLRPCGGDHKARGDPQPLVCTWVTQRMTTLRSSHNEAQVSIGVFPTLILFLCHHLCALITTKATST